MEKQVSVSTSTVAAENWLSKAVISFFAIIAIRIFLDNFASPNVDGRFFGFERLLHAPLYFGAVFASWLLLLHFFTQASARKILTFLVQIAPLIWLAPLADLIFKGIQPEAMRYLLISPTEIMPTFFKLMNPLSGNGITLGMHISAYLTFGAFFFFVYRQTRQVSKAVSVLFCGYLILFFYAILPSILVWLNVNQTGAPAVVYESILRQSWLANTTGFNFFLSPNKLHEQAIGQTFWLLLIGQLVLYLIVSRQKIWQVLRAELRLERIFNFFIIAGIGLMISRSLKGSLYLENPLNLITLLLFLSLIALSAWLAVFVNDLEDIEIDRISNQKRPLVSGQISVSQWQMDRNLVALLLALGLLVLGGVPAFLLLFVQGLYFLYSTPPLKLKRHFVGASFVAGLAAMAVAMAGFFLVSPDQQILAYPAKAIFMIGFFHALLSNIKDIKDYFGDKQNGIQTIPVWLGLRKSKQVIASLFWVAFLTVPLILNLKNFLPLAVPIAILATYAILKKDYWEKGAFLAIFVYMLALFGALV